MITMIDTYTFSLHMKTLLEITETRLEDNEEIKHNGIFYGYQMVLKE